MPLLTSPVDGSPMRRVNRHGVEIDICPTSGGIWLDKGELEKLTALFRDDDDDYDDKKPIAYRAPSGHYYENDDDKYGYSRGYDRKYKRKSKASRLMDIFDF